MDKIKSVTFFCAALIWMVLFTSGHLFAATLTLESSQDAHVGTGGSGYGDPTKNHGARTDFAAGVEGSITTRSFIKFDLASLPTNATINSAELSLFVTQRSSDSTPLIAGAHPSANWNESTITWIPITAKN